MSRSAATEPCATCSVVLSSRCGLELQALEAAKSQNQTPGKVSERTEPGWEVVMEKKDFKVWRRPIPDSHLYEYRGQSTQSHLGAECVCGTMFNGVYRGLTQVQLPRFAVLGSYDDVTPRQFFNVQVVVITMTLKDINVSLRSQFNLGFDLCCSLLTAFSLTYKTYANAILLYFFYLNMYIINFFFITYIV